MTMLSLFRRIKKSVLSKFNNISRIKKQEIYKNIVNIKRKELNSDYYMINSGSDSENEFNSNNCIINESTKNKTIISENEPQIILFSTILDKKMIDNDYILYDMRQTLLNRNINVEYLELDEEFEKELSICCDKIQYDNYEENIEVFKIKMRYIYVIIANDLHERLFDIKKQYYNTNDDKHSIGVYKYDKYIIRVDNSHHCFDSEKIVTNKISFKESKINNIVLPFLFNIEYNKTDIEMNNDVITYSTHLKRQFKKLNISYSIQPYIKNTDSLLNWVKYSIHERHCAILMSELRKTFIIQLFYKCVCLIETLHSHNIVHGDIKPDNIIINELDNFNISHFINYKNFNVYLIDFGLSGENGKDSGTGGTTPYCHPEFNNFRDLNNADKYKWKIMLKKHDVWSLGLAFITFYIFGKFISYYYKYPNYFFRKDGYINEIIFDSIGNSKIRTLFKDILSSESITIDNLKIRLFDICNN